jgi:hypothetical protein
MQKSLSRYFLFLKILILVNLALINRAQSQISGSVFEYSSPDKQIKTAGFGKVFSNVHVKAYGITETGKQELLAQTQTDSKGNYFLHVSEGKQVKLVFEEPSKKFQSSRSTPQVRFVKSPATDINWEVYQPSHSVSGNPYLVSPVYINGKGIDSLSALSALSMDGEKPVTLATSRQVGALWAVAYDRTSKQLYSAAFAKRHVGYGPLGTGGIYRTNWLTRTTSNWLDLHTLGIPTGDDHHEGLKAAIDSISTDPKLMADVGKLSLGGMDIAEDTQVLYVMNLYDRTLYGIKLPADTTAKPTKEDVIAYPMQNAGCNGGIGRPFAVKVYGDKVYVGIVCDAQNSQVAKDLVASVYSLDPATKKFSQVFSMPLDYTRGKAVSGLDVQSWYPWTDDFSKALHSDYPSTATRPQPVLSSIAFDAAGVMVLGFMDRFGHQSGTGQPDPGGRAGYSGVAAGDVLRVYPRKPGNTGTKFRLEGNAIAGDVTSEGKGNFQGPDGGEFFFQDGFAYRDEKKSTRIVHEETGAGGLVILPGAEEILMTAHEPTDAFNSGGIKSFFGEDGKTNRGWLLYTDGQIGTFGKANGVGGLAIISDLPGIAVGNRIWSDKNADGVQDPDEEAIPGVTLELWQKESRLGVTTSDDEGNYHFNEENIKDGLKPGTEYEIKVDLKEQELRPSVTKITLDQELDNDGIEKDGYAVAAFKTGKAGENMHSLDFGFLPEQKEAEKIENSGSFVVYPNPVVKELNVEIKANAKSAILRLVDVAGQILKVQEIKAEQGMYKTKLTLSGYPAGSYVISVDEMGSVRTAVVMKQ